MKRLLLLLLLAPLAAGGDEVERLRGLAQRFVEREKPGDAIRTLTEALALAPQSVDVHHDLLKLHVGDPKGLLTWGHVLADRLTDAKGIFRRPSGFSGEVWRGIQPALEFARMRAVAVDRLLAQAKRAREPSLAHYLREIGLEMTAGVPALRAKALPLLDKAVARTRPDPVAVLTKLQRAMLGKLRAGDHDAAMRAAVILRGAAVQARRNKDKLKQAFETSAVQTMRRIRQADERAPARVEDLLGIAPEERPAWEAKHADWSNPALALSPNDRYRIESVCGLRSTAMATADVEAQHARLVAWYGQDPFVGAQGTVRLCKTAAELEGEGQPHYWAGGFQSGNITTIVVSSSSRNGIASTLTHELTHRFDGAIYPLMPAWLMEGRAVYTATTSLWPGAKTIEPRTVSFGAIYQTSVRGYGGKKKLQELIAGTIDDYRDNYQAGYTLWLYLTRWLKAPNVEKYLKSFKRKPGWDALKRFEHFFIGKDGWDAWVKGWRKFVGEGAATDAGPWKRAWQKEARAARKEANQAQAAAHREARGQELASPRDSVIFDRSNWGRIRGRSHDPELGERHAYAAGRWFESHGMKAEAAAAFAWARTVDELPEAKRRHVAAFHALRGKPALAWLWWPEGDVPAAVLPIQRLVKPVLARRLERTPYFSLLPGLVEEYWAPKESWERKNWFVDPNGTLLLGRKKPLDPTTGYKRDAYIRKVFVRGEEWFSGSYTIRTRVQLVSAHLGAAVVVGHTRHDRGMAVNVSGGDWSYATGRKEKTLGFASINVALDDLRAWDGGVNRLWRRIPFRTPRTSFLLTVHVTGPFVRVQIDGEDAMSHRTTTGLPIAGRVGFYLGSGLVAFDRPEARRHEVADEPFDLTKPCKVPYITMSGRRLVGVKPDPRGMVVLVFFDDSWKEADEARAIWKMAVPAAPLVIVRPPDAEGEGLKHHGLPALKKARAEWMADEAATRHKRSKKLDDKEAREEVEAEGRVRPAWLLVDPQGVIRDRGVWMEPSWRGKPHQLIRRLQGH